MPPSYVSGAALLLGVVSASLVGCGRFGLELTTDDAAISVDAGVDGKFVDASGKPMLDARLEAGGPLDGALDCAGDGDNDGVCDAEDNCPTVANAMQADGNADRVGDACDADGDGRPDVNDPCPADAADDSDGDGACDSADGCPGDATKQAPGACGCGVSAPLGLSGYWAFDEQSGSAASDTVGGRPGTLLNPGPAATWSAGRVGNALLLDGVDDRVQVGTVTPPLRSVSFWVKPTAMPALETVTRWLFPTTTGEPANGWKNPENAFLHDDKYADGRYTNGTAQDWTGFGVRLPSDATVRGIELDVWLNNANPTGLFDVRLSWNAGTDYTVSELGPVFPGPLNGYIDFGSQTDLWGQSAWTAAQLTDQNLRVQLSKQGAPGSPMEPGIDDIRLKIHHAPAPHLRTLVAFGGARVELSDVGVVLSGFPEGTSLYVDGLPSSVLDASWHHVVLVLPSELPVANLQVGGASDSAFPLAGQLDELKLFTQPLRTQDLTTLRTVRTCR